MTHGEHPIGSNPGDNHSLWDAHPYLFSADWATGRDYSGFFGYPGMYNDPYLMELGQKRTDELPWRYDWVAKAFQSTRGFGGKSTSALVELLGEKFHQGMQLHLDVRVEELLYGTRTLQLVVSEDHPLSPIAARIRVSPFVPKDEIWIWNPEKGWFDKIKWEEEFDVDDYNEALAEGAFDD